MKDEKFDLDDSKLKTFVESLRPENPETREQVDYGYSFDGSIVILFEIRPIWNKPQEKQEVGFAKIRYYKSRQEWNLYWMRASGKWELYTPFPESALLQKILDIIEEDENCCFFG